MGCSRAIPGKTPGDTSAWKNPGDEFTGGIYRENSEAISQSTSTIICQGNAWLPWHERNEGSFIELFLFTREWSFGLGNIIQIKLIRFNNKVISLGMYRYINRYMYLWFYAASIGLRRDKRHLLEINSKCIVEVVFIESSDYLSHKVGENCALGTIENKLICAEGVLS